MTAIGIAPWLFVNLGLLVVLSSLGLSFAEPQVQDEEVSNALEAGDECKGSEEGVGACGLSAIQLRRGVRERERERKRESVSGSSVRSEAASSLLRGWAPQRRCSGTEVHELGFVVRQGNIERLRALAIDVTDPDSPRYRQWLSRSEVKRLTSNEGHVLAVKSWLGGHPDISISHTSDEGELVLATAPVAAWERLFGAEFQVYLHEESDEQVIRAPDYLLPGTLDPHVEAVFGLEDFEVLRPKSVPGIPPDLQGEAGWQFGHATLEDLVREKGPATTPETFRERYNVPGPAARGSKAAEEDAATWQVVFATLGQYWSPSDRAFFQRSFGIPDDNYVRQLEGQLSGNAMSGDLQCRERPTKCAESNLDVQYMMGLAPWAQMGYWYMPEANAKGMASFLNAFMEKFVHADSCPHVISISYGMPEFSVSKGSMILFETLAMKLTARGVTILAASGDDGAASFLARKVLHGQTCWHVPVIGLQPSWPGISEWVTSVGATMGAELGQPDIACSANETKYLPLNGTTPLITSGGGYSKKLARPSWQSGVHNETGRGAPDVALAGHAFAMVLGQRWTSVDGTSASTPALAGMISLINARLLAQGKPTVGFLNPFLYKHSSVFTDVTVGDNKCAALGAPCCGGYDCAEGWDPVTGLGVPDFAKLEAAILGANA